MGQDNFVWGRQKRKLNERFNQSIKYLKRKPKSKRGFILPHPAPKI